MNVHPIPPKVLVARHNQLLRFESNRQPLERSQVAHSSFFCLSGAFCWCRRNTPSKQTMPGRGATLKSYRGTSASLTCLGHSHGPHISLRRRKPTTPTSPDASRTMLPGSGTAVTVALKWVVSNRKLPSLLTPKEMTSPAFNIRAEK